MLAEDAQLRQTIARAVIQSLVRLRKQNRRNRSPALTSWCDKAKLDKLLDCRYETPTRKRYTSKNSEGAKQPISPVFRTLAYQPLVSTHERERRINELQKRYSLDQDLWTAAKRDESVEDDALSYEEQRFIFGMFDICSDTLGRHQQDLRRTA